MRVKSTIEGIVLFPEASDLRKALQVSAAHNNRSITAEAEARLIDSFEQDRIFGRPETYALLALLAKDIERIERDLGMSWLDAGEQSENIVAEELIASFSERVIWELSRNDRVKARGLKRQKADLSPTRVEVQSTVHFATPEEVAAFKPARTVLPPEIGDRALFDETMAPPRPDEGDAPQPAPGKPSAPVPARTRRARAKV